MINAALGFDSYLVMRHGAKGANAPLEASLKELKGFQFIEGRNLGCYFCNDVTAPGNVSEKRVPIFWDFKPHFSVSEKPNFGPTMYGHKTWSCPNCGRFSG